MPYKNPEDRAKAKRRYYEAHRETVIDRVRQSRARDPATHRAADRQRYETNREEVIERSRLWYAENRERNARVSKEYRRANLEAEIERNRRWREANPDIVKNQGQLRRARKRVVTVEVFTAADLAAHYATMGYDGCAYCSGPHEHDDHIVPLARGGAHTLNNLAPACARCNLSKGSKMLAEWLGFTS